ncbi:hypothetical protein VNO78_12238 [Psophocarpus tetragonolobus]|uniref:Uncharacterized protein n=1 Tax=Psophocarpus tetragonolobus TaxID=3891 RepID=A0AAN9XP94_PSOTE
MSLLASDASVSKLDATTKEPCDDHCNDSDVNSQWVLHTVMGFTKQEWLLAGTEEFDATSDAWKKLINYSIKHTSIVDMEEVWTELHNHAGDPTAGAGPSRELGQQMEAHSTGPCAGDTAFILGPFTRGLHSGPCAADGGPSTLGL